MAAVEGDLARLRQETSNLTGVGRYKEALVLNTNALEKWRTILSPTQHYHLRGTCGHCQYFDGQIAAAESTLTALIREREEARILDLSYLNEIRTLAFVKRAQCDFDEAGRLLRAVAGQLECNKQNANCSKLLQQVEEDIADTLAIKEGKRTKSALCVEKTELVGLFGTRTISVGPLEIPDSVLSVSCEVRTLELVFTTLHSATLRLEFVLDNTASLTSWGDPEETPVLFLVMFPRFGKIHHGRFHLDIDGDEALRQQVALENHPRLIVHPRSYQPMSLHPLPQCRTYRYATGDCSTFRGPVPPHASIRFEGQLDFASGPDESGAATSTQLVRSIWVLLPYGTVELSSTSIKVKPADVELVSSVVARAPFQEDRTRFKPGEFVIDAGTRADPEVGPPVAPQRRGLLRRGITVNDLDFLLLETRLQPKRPVAASLHLASDALPLGIVNDLPDTRVRTAAHPEEVGSFNLSGEHPPLTFAKVLLENFSSQPMPMHVSIRADLLGVALDRDVELAPFQKQFISLSIDLRPRLDFWSPSEDESYPIECTPFDIVVTGGTYGKLRLATPIRVLPPDYAVWSISEPSEGNLVDLRLLIARWVTPAAPAVRALLEEARAVNTGDPVRDLQVVYEYLAHKELLYDMSRIVFGAEMEYRFQRVRFPSVTLRHRRMNCIDGTVLFASCAEALGHRPAVVFVPEHAFLALLDGPPGAIRRMAFVETTLACSEGHRRPASYGHALAAGMQKFEESKGFLLAGQGPGTYKAIGLNPYRIVPIELARKLNVRSATEWIQ